MPSAGYRSWLAAFVMVCVASAACGPSAPSGVQLTGHWVALGPGHTPPIHVMTLEQVGDAITGTACMSSSGVTVYSGVPVRGTYPDVHYTVPLHATAPCCAALAGRTFSGRFDNTLDIVGSDLRFTRSETRPAC